MDSKQFREAAYSAVDEIANYYETIEDRRVMSAVEPGYLKKLLPDSAPEQGEKWEDIQKDIEEKIVPGLTHWQSPNFMAFFPACSSYPGMLGELYSAAFTAPAFNWICSPAVTELETIVLDWLANLLALPACFLSSGEGGGVIQGSASEAVVVAVVAARDRYLRETTAHLAHDEAAREKLIGEKRARLVALGSDQSHSCTAKAALIAGTKYRSVSTTLADDLSMTGESLQRTLEQCKADGLEPFYLTATLGTTATCAVDRLSEVRDVIASHPHIWVHVDAAYAGAALVCPEYQHLTASFEAFDSFDMNMHKWLLTNFDASCMFVRRRRDLIDAFSITPSYLRNEFSEKGLVTDYRDWQIPLGRRFRALKVWFVLRSFGAEGLRSHIRKTVALGDVFSSLVKSRTDLFRIVTPPAFGLTVFNLVPSPAGATASEEDRKAAGNALTKEVYELINSRGQIYITSSVVSGGVYVIRVLSANPLAEEKFIRRAFEIVVATAEEVLAARK